MKLTQYLSMLPILVVMSCSTYTTSQDANRVECANTEEEDAGSRTISTRKTFDLDKYELAELLQRGKSDGDVAYRLYQYYKATLRNYPEALKWLETAVSLEHHVAIMSYEAIKEWPGLDIYRKGINPPSWGAEGSSGSEESNP